MGHLKDKSFVRITPKVARVGKAGQCQSPLPYYYQHTTTQRAFQSKYLPKPRTNPHMVSKSETVDSYKAENVSETKK